MWPPCLRRPRPPRAQPSKDPCARCWAHSPSARSLCAPEYLAQKGAEGPPAARVSPMWQPRICFTLVVCVFSNRALIGIAGVPGSGKSTLARRLARVLDRRGDDVEEEDDSKASTSTSARPQQEACVVSMDGFHYPKSYLDAQDEPAAWRTRRGAPWTFDSAAFVRCLQRVRRDAREDVGVPSFNHGIGDPENDGITVSSHCSIVFVEGLYLFLGACRSSIIVRRLSK